MNATAPVLDQKWNDLSDTHLCAVVSDVCSVLYRHTQPTALYKSVLPWIYHIGWASGFLGTFLRISDRSMRRKALRETFVHLLRRKGIFVSRVGMIQGPRLRSICVLTKGKANYCIILDARRGWATKVVPLPAAQTTFDREAANLRELQRFSVRSAPALIQCATANQGTLGLLTTTYIKGTIPCDRDNWNSPAAARIWRELANLMLQTKISEQVALPAYVDRLAAEAGNHWPAETVERITHLVSRQFDRNGIIARQKLTTSLIHGDMNRHNIIQTRDGLVFIDWASAGRYSVARQIVDLESKVVLRGASLADVPANGWARIRDGGSMSPQELLRPGSKVLVDYLASSLPDIFDEKYFTAHLLIGVLESMTFLTPTSRKFPRLVRFLAAQ